MSCETKSYVCFFFFQAEDGIRDLVRSRGLGDVYKRQDRRCTVPCLPPGSARYTRNPVDRARGWPTCMCCPSCLLYTSDAADERSSVDLGGRRIIKKKKKNKKRKKKKRLTQTLVTLSDKTTAHSKTIYTKEPPDALK